MPLPSPIPPLIPKPDVQEDINTALKKAIALGSAMGAAYYLNPKFPVTTPKITHFLFGFETKPLPARSILIKPFFVTTAFPEPIGAVPPTLTGLPRSSSYLENYFSRTKMKEELNKDQLAHLEVSFAKTAALVEEFRPAFQQRDIEFVRKVRSNSAAALEKLGPRPTGPTIIRFKDGHVDSRVFYAIMLAEAEAELDRRNAIDVEQFTVDPTKPQTRPLHLPRFNKEREDGGGQGKGFSGVTFVDDFFKNNPPDP